MNPFQSIWDDRPAAPVFDPVKAVRKAKPPADHTAARALYARYLARLAELEPLRAYASAVCRATSGNGMTPVMPLATMGTGGGALLCDHCGKPMILEGGQYDRVNVDVAWASNPQRGPNWRSYISGGVVVEIATNGTLRIYHGHVGDRPGECSTKGKAATEAADEAFDKRVTHAGLVALFAFASDEFPDLTERERNELVNAIVNTLYTYDPGDGVNKPS